MPALWAAGERVSAHKAARRERRGAHAAERRPEGAWSGSGRQERTSVEKVVPSLRQRQVSGRHEQEGNLGLRGAQQRGQEGRPEESHKSVCGRAHCSTNPASSGCAPPDDSSPAQGQPESEAARGITQRGGDLRAKGRPWAHPQYLAAGAERTPMLGQARVVRRKKSDAGVAQRTR